MKILSILAWISSTGIQNSAFAGNYCSVDNSCSTRLSVCISDCKAIVSAAKTEIADLTKVATDQGNTITDLKVSQDTITKDRDNARASLAAWYHSPFVLIPAGIVLGGAAVLVLER